MKSIVIYYSLEGNTRTVAETLATHLSADLLEIKPTKEIDCRKRSKYLWGGRQAIMKTKPIVEPYTFYVKNYDLIVLGSPVWALTYAPPLRTFLSENEIKKKLIILFCTHEGAAGSTLKRLKEELKDNRIISSKDFNRAHENYSTDVNEWVQHITSKEFLDVH